MEEFRQFREFLIEGFKHHSDAFEGTLQRYQNEHDAFKQRAIRSAELETENASLRSELELIKKKLFESSSQAPRESHRPERLSSAASERSSNHTPSSSGEFELKHGQHETFIAQLSEPQLRIALQKKCNDYTKLANAQQVLIERCRTLQSSLQHWEAYSQKTRSEQYTSYVGSPDIAGRAAVQSPRPLAPAESTPLCVAIEDPCINLFIGNSTDNQQRLELQGTKQRSGRNGALANVFGASEVLVIPNHEEQVPQDDVDAVAGSTSSESSSRCELIPNTTIGHDNSSQSSDIPVFVSERCLKRKRRTAELEEANCKRECDAGLGIQVITVKNEPDSSPPSHYSALEAVTHDTLDLDDISLPLMSPEAAFPSIPQKRIKKQKIQSFPTAQNKFHKHGSQTFSTLNSIQAQDVDSLRDKSREGFRNRPLQPMQKSAIPPPYSKSKRVGSSHPNDPLTSTGNSSRSPGSHLALQPKTPNQKVFSVANDLTVSNNKKRKVQEIAEDAENYAPFVDTSLAGAQYMTPPNQRQTLTDGRQLNCLLNTSYSRQSLLSDSKQKSRKPAQKAFSGPTIAHIKPSQTPQAAFLSTTKGTIDINKTVGKELHLQEISTCIRRLRDRELVSLRLEDFKINPEANSNCDYAYSEVVRRRAERKCLPNCTKPECCGEVFQKAVEIGGYMPSPRLNTFESAHHFQGSRISSGSADDHSLLTEYLGSKAGQLEHMADVEKQYLLTKARAQKFANSHGKHRQAHERPSSPPGFWRTDMPSTQEHEADRKSAQAMERRKVEERWREALRPGGRWMFRDE